jgi:hypothetical protein
MMSRLFVKVITERLTICKTKREEDILDTGRIVAELKSQRDRLSRAIAALEGHSSKVLANRSTVSHQAARTKKKRDRLTPAGRKRLSELMKKRWAEKKKKASKAH